MPDADAAEATDAELVIAARKGDLRAKEALFRRHARMVNGLAFRLLGRDDRELDEVVQDVFVGALRGLPTLREPAAFGTWIGSIVVHVVRRRIRRRRLAAALGLGAHREADVEAIARGAAAEAAVELRMIYGRIERLGAEERIVLLLHRVEGYTLPELAARMSLSLATVKRRLQSAESKIGVRREEGDEA